VAPFQWGSEGGAMTLRFDSTRAEGGGSQWCTSRRRRPQAAKALPNEGGRRSPRWAGVATLTGLQLGQSGSNGPTWGENKATVQAKIVNGLQKFF
jgi:hypothetical protein